MRTNEIERQSVLRSLEQINKLSCGNQEERALLWYFLNFGQGYGYLTRQGDLFCARHGWLTPQQLGSHLGIGAQQPYYLAIRPAKWSSWVLIDIDEGSRYHPGSFDGEGDLPVKAALKTIGLHEPIELQSSISTGMHLLYPLDAVVSTWELAQS